jgi:molybdate transport system substrate-binding protein
MLQVVGRAAVNLRILPIFVLLLMPLGARCAPGQDAIMVFAASSMRNVLDEIDSAFTKASGEEVVVSYAATSALAKQIEQGAPADVFVSADSGWMNYATERKLVDDSTRIDLLGNRLVLIAPKDSKLDNVTIGANFDIAGIAGDGRIAIAAPTGVPAGRYAKAALQSLGVWAASEPKLAPAENVRAVLAYVARGEAPIGIVYETDAKVEPNVKIVGRFPDNSYPSIIYSVATVAASKNTGVAAYLRFLRTSQARAVFERYGFIYLPDPSS